MAGFALLAIIVFGLLGNALQNAGGSISLVCDFAMLNNDILLAVALYRLLEPVNAPLALLGLLWRFANALILGVGVVAALTALKLQNTGGSIGADPAHCSKLYRRRMPLYVVMRA